MARKWWLDWPVWSSWERSYKATTRYQLRKPLELKGELTVYGFPCIPQYGLILGRWHVGWRWKLLEWISDNLLYLPSSSYLRSRACRQINSPCVEFSFRHDQQVASKLIVGDEISLLRSSSFSFPYQLFILTHSSRTLPGHRICAMRWGNDARLPDQTFQRTPALANNGPLHCLTKKHSPQERYKLPTSRSKSRQ